MGNSNVHPGGATILSFIYGTTAEEKEVAKLSRIQMEWCHSIGAADPMSQIACGHDIRNPDGHVIAPAIYRVTLAARHDSLTRRRSAKWRT